MKEKKKSCFVIIGYGKKTTWGPDDKKRILDLGKTYHNLIEPVLDSLDFDYFRASDKNYENCGYIDKDMYEYILESDLVVADISTLNPNAIYELGIRHALRPQTTIIICEDRTSLPFDVNHISIDKYRHLGEDIGVTEAQRFQKDLKKKITAVMGLDKVDSPIYTFIPNLIPPIMKTFKTSKDDQTIKPMQNSSNKSLSELIELAEIAKKNLYFIEAKGFLKRALNLDRSDSFLRQRLALVTYKSKHPNERESLYQAATILKGLNNKYTTDNETIGLSGAVYKRLFELDGNESDLQTSIRHYQRSFNLNNDHWAGINLAYCFTIKAARVSINKSDIVTDFTNANRVRHEIIILCKEQIESVDFKEMSKEDKDWIYLSMAEAFYGLGDIKQEQEVLNLVKKSKGDLFSLDSYNEQKEKLNILIKESQTKIQNS